ncbi:hypothetical protein [Oryza sativa Japonica Group]|uniref:Uncharacterized protein n=1 Tax=Oryza sativa subsp. japonica TaxID=39947 RepID=Q5QM55_ORYSJ|nr:hypothetical protein [Oryza sativa Japonica Group]BAD87071.1 hypothetical protein [Oryza sativa Japonica Group]
MAHVSECSTQCSDGKGTTATTTAATTILPLPLSPSASMAGLRAYGAETSAMAIHLSFSPLSPSKRRASEGGAPGRGRGCQRGLALRPCHVGEGIVLGSMWARDQRQRSWRWYVQP